MNVHAERLSGDRRDELVTAHARVEDRALHCGFQIYASGPRDPTRLADVVAAVVHR